MVRTAPTATPLLPLAQDRAQAHAKPAIQRPERGRVTMLEIHEPSHQRLVHRLDDDFKAAAMSASCLTPNRVFQFDHAFAARPTVSSLKVIAQKVEPTSLRGVDDSRLFRMQLQTSTFDPLLHYDERRSGLSFAPTENDEVICVAHHLVATPGHLMVQRVKIDVRQQRADNCSLWSSLLRGPVFQPIHHSLSQHGRDQFQHSAVCHLLLHLSRQLAPRDGVEVAPQISIDHPGVSRLQQTVYPTQRVFASPSRTKPIALFSKVSFEDRFQHVTQRRLHYSVAHRRNAKRAFLSASRLSNPLTSHRLRRVTAIRQLLRQSRQVRLQVRLEHLNRLVVYSRSTLVGFHSRKCRPQIPHRVEFVYQTEPDAPFYPHFEGGQHPFGPDRWFGPPPSGFDLSDLFSLWHWRRSGFHRSVPYVSTFLRSLRSTPITELHRYYGRSDSCVAGSSAPLSMNTVLSATQVSLIHANSLPDHSVSKHQGNRSRRFCTLPLSATASRFRFRVRHWLAGSPIAPGRIEFVILRTGRSPPAALHHASLRRSCIRLQAGERLPGEDFHLSDYSRFQAH